ncbi:MAG: carbohydrate kinase family protein [Gammaproteobacteria bacterium TMED119]|nr:MAG: carbohydrate kinase family protein [Gammaproteobacteria bacterium TMED119]RCL44537.1 MAG: carbohydrate kinase family protein [Candidatus Thioglobus sp.]|tara:strand:- start:2078 stop:3010 length:933 start_codon:yes stop_codon:yes gene_type:complete
MTALICGSFAYDNIMSFQDRFKNHILPDKVHILNVCFLVPAMRKEFGGCAGNIAYNLHLLGGDGKPMGTVGSDFAPYAEWMDKVGIRQDYLKVVEHAYTAQAFITTDLDDNQITAFHPGAMDLAHTQTIPTDAGISLGLISPDGRAAMLEHAQQFSAAKIPFIFDPGQGLPMFDGAELNCFIDQASYVTVNDYEAQLLQDRTGLSEQQISERVEALIITQGAQGSKIYHRGKHMHIPALAVTDIKDPTGCGDAYRAGLIYGIMHQLDWLTTGQIATLLGALKIQHHGTQNHHFTLDQFKHQFEAAYGKTF